MREPIDCILESLVCKSEGFVYNLGSEISPRWLLAARPSYGCIEGVPLSTSSMRPTKKMKVSIRSPPSRKTFEEGDPRRHQEKHFSKVAKLDEFRPHADDVQARRSFEASLYKYPLPADAAKARNQAVRKNIAKRDAEELIKMGKRTRHSTVAEAAAGGAATTETDALCSSIDPTTGLPTAWLQPLQHTIVDCDIFGECVPSMLLHLLAHLQRAPVEAAASLVESILAEVGIQCPVQGDCERLAVRRWLVSRGAGSAREHMNKLPIHAADQAKFGVMLPLGLLHHSLQAVGIGVSLIVNDPFITSDGIRHSYILGAVPTNGAFFAPCVGLVYSRGSRHLTLITLEGGQANLTTLLGHTKQMGAPPDDLLSSLAGGDATRPRSKSQTPSVLQTNKPSPSSPLVLLNSPPPLLATSCRLSSLSLSTLQAPVLVQLFLSSLIVEYLRQTSKSRPPLASCHRALSGRCRCSLNSTFRLSELHL